jgi:hypothetical protein
MIKRIFQDLDECILHTMVNNIPKEGEQYVEFILSESMHTYRALIRPCAKALFEYYNSVVGKENVYILTTATRDYAEELNRLGGFGLDNDHIFTREDIQQYSVSIGYDGQGVVVTPIADKDNILIDNLPPLYNSDKVNMMGIRTINYHQTPEYYGNNSNDQSFFEGVKEFIKRRL